MASIDLQLFVRNLAFIILCSIIIVFLLICNRPCPLKCSIRCSTSPTTTTRPKSASILSRKSNVTSERTVLTLMAPRNWENRMKNSQLTSMVAQWRSLIPMLLDSLKLRHKSKPSNHASFWTSNRTSSQQRTRCSKSLSYSSPRRKNKACNSSKPSFRTIRFLLNMLSLQDLTGQMPMVQNSLPPQQARSTHQRCLCQLSRPMLLSNRLQINNNSNNSSSRWSSSSLNLSRPFPRGRFSNNRLSKINSLIWHHLSLRW